MNAVGIALRALLTIPWLGPVLCWMQRPWADSSLFDLTAPFLLGPYSSSQMTLRNSSLKDVRLLTREGRGGEKTGGMGREKN